METVTSRWWLNNESNDMDDMETRLRYEFSIELQKLRKRIEALENKPKSNKFKKPTVAEVADYMRKYCHEKGIQTNADPQQFVDFYESKGWKVGKVSMKSWEASCRTWINRDKSDKKDYVVDLARRAERWQPPEDLAHSLFGDE